MISRRTLARLAGGAAATAVAHRAASAAEPVRLLVGFGPNSPMDFSARLVQRPFAQALGQPVRIDYVIGDGSRKAAQEVIGAKGDSHTLLVADIFLLCMHDAKGADLVSRLKPVAKLSRGISYCLAVREDSPLADWAGFVAAAKGAPLTVATAGSLSAPTVLVDMIEQRTGLALKQSPTRSTHEALGLLMDGKVELAAIDTRLALLHNDQALDEVRVLATFGAQRSPDLPLVPTFAEIVADPKAAFTQSFAIFAPPAMEAGFVSRSTAALTGISDDNRAFLNAKKVRFPLQIEGPEVVMQTVARDRRVIASVIR